jgi:hypothetical protein
MADVRIENNPPVVEREVVREPVVDNSGGSALTIVAILLIALLAVGAFIFMSQNRSTPANDVTSAVSNGVERAGDAVGDAANTVKE